MQQHKQRTAARAHTLVLPSLVQTCSFMHSVIHLVLLVNTLVDYSLGLTGVCTYMHWRCLTVHVYTGTYLSVKKATCSSCLDYAHTIPNHTALLLLDSVLQLPAVSSSQYTAVVCYCNPSCALSLLLVCSYNRCYRCYRCYCFCYYMLLLLLLLLVAAALLQLFSCVVVQSSSSVSSSFEPSNTAHDNAL
jgi:hypothetical protein